MHLIGVWQLVGSSSNFILRESDPKWIVLINCWHCRQDFLRKYHSCQTEEDHGDEAEPLGVDRDGPLEDGCEEEDEGGGDTDASEEDEEETD